MNIRTATIQDLTVIQELNHELFLTDNRHNDLYTEWPYSEVGEQYFRQCIEDSNTLLSLVAEDKNEVIGYLNARIQARNSAYLGRRAEIENMYVRDEFRSKGIGKLLVEGFKEWAKKKGAARLMVEAFTGNHGAIKFYKNQGFSDYANMLSQVVEE